MTDLEDAARELWNQNRGVITVPMIAAALRQRADEATADAYGYAKRFLEAFVAENFPPNPDWKPLPDLMGVLMQIDNASTIVRDLRQRADEATRAENEACAQIADYGDDRFIAKAIRARIAPKE
jgi:hypothetical protein